MKNSASVDNTLLDLQNSSYPTQPHSIIAKYYFPGLKSSFQWSVESNQAISVFGFGFNMVLDWLRSLTDKQLVWFRGHSSEDLN